jgi:hypothetical protein
MRLRIPESEMARFGISMAGLFILVGIVGCVTALSHKSHDIGISAASQGVSGTPLALDVNNNPSQPTNPSIATSDHGLTTTVLPPTTVDNDQAKSQTVYTPPAAVQVDCSAKDAENVATYNTWASGVYSDLAKYENGVIPDAPVLGTYDVLSGINNNIDTLNAQSEKNLGTYDSEDAQFECAPSLSGAYIVPICTDLNKCLSQIPSVP